jgi:hypothetical protein
MAESGELIIVYNLYVKVLYILPACYPADASEHCDEPISTEQRRCGVRLALGATGIRDPWDV